MLDKHEGILIVLGECRYPEQTVALGHPQYLVDEAIRHTLHWPVRVEIGEFCWHAASYQLGPEVRPLDERPEGPVMRICRFFLITHDLDAGLGQTHAGTEITVALALPVMPKGAYSVEVNAVLSLHMN